MAFDPPLFLENHIADFWGHGVTSAAHFDTIYYQIYPECTMGPAVEIDIFEICKSKRILHGAISSH